MTDNRQVVVVTGGTRGVGAGIARGFLAAGAHVVICARNPPAEPVRAPRQGAHRREGPSATAEFRPVDLRDPDAARAFCAGVGADRGRIDVLVNNAGGTPYGLLADTSAARQAKIVQLNLLAPLYTSLAAHEVMSRQEKGGVIIMIGSVSGTRPSPGSGAYGAAKAGLENLARTMAVEWAPHVRVNTVVLGLVRTESAPLHYGDEDGVAAVARTIPLARLAEPADAADACLFLASDAARYVSGAALHLHGGGERPAFLDAATVNH
ncbi:SDR family oxidoreductase [Streptomyces sp. CC224B]|uniref:SDR family oxidoreductase n=1 Tax=Streptomyces sp. CC224B TaxID=3044571 RepID=UPI0024A94C3B|nr:SDR family oxidoreductase [Streptomyces sp. CC224B]